MFYLVPWKMVKASVYPHSLQMMWVLAACACFLDKKGYLKDILKMVWVFYLLPQGVAQSHMLKKRERVIEDLTWRTCREGEERKVRKVRHSWVSKSGWPLAEFLGKETRQLHSSWKNSGPEQWYVHVSMMWIRRSTSGLSENLISESFMQVMTKRFMFRNLSSSLGSDLRLLFWLPQIW